MNLEIIHNFEKFLGNKGYSPQTIRTYTKALEQAPDSWNVTETQLLYEHINYTLTDNNQTFSPSVRHNIGPASSLFFQMQTGEVFRNYDRNQKYKTTRNKELLEEFYKDFTDNRYQSLDEVADKILELYEDSRTREICHMDIEKKIKESFSKKDVVCKLVHTKMNEEFLQNVPHREWLDLSIVYMIKFDAKDSVSTVTVTNEILKTYDLREEELYEIALEHINREGYTFKTIVQTLQDLQEDLEICDIVENLEDDNCLYVLTKPTVQFGATVILSNDILEEIASRLKTDYYIIPSSIDEVLIVPSYADIDRKMMDTMIQEVNETQVSKEERLSDHAYYYSIEERKIFL